MKRFTLILLTASFYNTIFGLKLSDTVMVGENPLEIVVNSVSNKVYVSCNGFPSSCVAILDVNSHHVTYLQNIDPRAIKVNEKTDKIYVLESDRLIVLDGKTNGIDKSIDLKSSFGMVINPTNNFIYVGSNDDTSLAEINPLTYQVRYISTMYCNFDLKINSKTNTLYILHGVFDTLSIINLNNYNIKKIPDNDCDEFCINELTNKIYLSNMENGNVFEIDGVDNSSAVIPSKWGSYGMEINERENKVYLLCGDQLIIINRAAKTESNLYIGKDLRSLKLNKTTNKLYISSYRENKIVVVDGKSDQIIDSVSSPLFNALTKIAVNEKTNQIFVINRNGGGQMPGFFSILNEESAVLTHSNKPVMSNVELTGDCIKIRLQKEMSVSLKCVDLQGKIIQEKFIGKLKAGVYNLPIVSSGLSKGMYVFQIITGDKINSIRYEKK